MELIKKIDAFLNEDLKDMNTLVNKQKLPKRKEFAVKAMQWIIGGKVGPAPSYKSSYARPGDIYWAKDFIEQLERANKEVPPLESDIKKDWMSIWREATAEAEKAMKAEVSKLVPMVVQQRANPLDDTSNVIKQWHVPGGVCGFAWVEIRYVGAINRAFINALKKAGIVGPNGMVSYSDYSKAYIINVPRLDHIAPGPLCQSMQLKQAWTHGLMKVLGKHNITGWAQSRMD